MRLQYLLCSFLSFASAYSKGLFTQEVMCLASYHLRKKLTLSQPPLVDTLDTCDCSGTNDTGNSGVSYICHDPRLGPARLPKTFPLLSFVSDYDRFGGETPGEFLKRWTGKDGYYVYPPQNGFQLDTTGNPILGNMTLLEGTKVDRFGSEYGMPICKFNSLI